MLYCSAWAVTHRSSTGSDGHGKPNEAAQASIRADTTIRRLSFFEPDHQSAPPHAIKSGQVAMVLLFWRLVQRGGYNGIPLTILQRASPHRSEQMAVKVRSRREKVGSGLGLVMGLIAFNLIAPLLLESKEISDMNRMIGAVISAMICSELGVRVGKWLDAREQAKSPE